MTHRLGYLISLIFAVLLVSGCCPYSWLNRLDNISPNEAIAIAKIHILYNGKDISNGSYVIFNFWGTGFPKYQYPVRQDGYIFARLPVGMNGMSSITRGSGLSHGMKKGELTCQLKDGGVINYLGDITFNWSGKASGSETGAFFRNSTLLGVLLMSEPDQGQINVSVESNAKEAQEAFRRKFPDSREDITPALLVVKPSS
ncbi:MAG: hypothetical protein NTX01_06955 [Candidatus Omnitrophica bacterium]|nr:hypothetical protein [Candidatus Omnitrophota bacterium]